MNMVARQAAVDTRAAVAPDAFAGTAVLAPPAQARWWLAPFTTVTNAAGSAVLWTYDILVTRRLRAFYFDTIWGNLPPWQVCAEMTKTSADHWARSPENIADCQVEMERRFVSWDRAAMTAIWFALLAFVSIRVLCCCWNLDFLPGSRRGGRRGHDSCDCECCARDGAHGGGFRSVDIEELRKILLSDRTADGVPIQKKLYNT